jgi:hypothetical protein
VVDFALQSASNDQELDALGLELLAQHVDGFVDSDSAAAVEEINGSVAVFGPGVNGVVAFLDDNGAAHSEGFELVKGLLHDGRFAFDSGLSHRFADVGFAFEEFAFAAVEFDEQVRAEGGHFARISGEAFFIATEPGVERLGIFAEDRGPAVLGDDSGWIGDGVTDIGFWLLPSEETPKKAPKRGSFLGKGDSGHRQSDGRAKTGIKNAVGVKRNARQER